MRRVIAVCVSFFNDFFFYNDAYLFRIKYIYTEGCLLTLRLYEMQSWKTALLVLVVCNVTAYVLHLRQFEGEKVVKADLRPPFVS